MKVRVVVSTWVWEIKVLFLFVPINSQEKSIIMEAILNYIIEPKLMCEEKVLLQARFWRSAAKLC